MEHALEPEKYLNVQAVRPGHLLHIPNGSSPFWLAFFPDANVSSLVYFFCFAKPTAIKESVFTNLTVLGYSHLSWESFLLRPSASPVVDLIHWLLWVEYKDRDWKDVENAHATPFGDHVASWVQYIVVGSVAAHQQKLALPVGCNRCSVSCCCLWMTKEKEIRCLECISEWLTGRVTMNSVHADKFVTADLWMLLLQ